MTKHKRNPDTVPNRFGGNLVAWAAWLYYVEGETQEGTARRLGMSRATVVNYLNEARDRGMVKITVDPEILMQGKLSEDLKERYGLSDVLILPKLDEDDEEMRKRAGIAGARVLRTLLKPNAVLGVAWGRTMYSLALAMERQPIEGTTVLQVSGSMLDESLSSPEFITSLIANRIGGRSLNFHAPAVLSNKSLRDSLLQEPPIARFMQRLRHCDVNVFGVGSIHEAAQLGDVNLADDTVLRTYKKKGAVSVIVGRFVNAQGQEIEGPLTDRQIAISLDDLKAAPVRLLVAAGERKADAVHAALTGGFATHVVVDFMTAEKLLEHR